MGDSDNTKGVTVFTSLDGNSWYLGNEERKVRDKP